MKYSEQTLKNWTALLSQTEEQRAENTIRMVKDAITSCDELNSMDIDIFLQGSYANNTNVRSDSDIDICVMLRDTFHSVYPEGKGREDYGFIESTFTFHEYRNLVKQALQNKFKIGRIDEGNKSLKINENTYHVNADVVPSFQLRNYYYENSNDPDNYIEGVWLISKTGEEVLNYPKRHKENGISKNINTNSRYKKLVRIMKHIKNEMVEDYKADGDKITSFLIECLIYNVPNNVITKYNTWTETVKQTIVFLCKEISNGNHNGWCEVSDMQFLFVNRKWTDKDVLGWLVDAFMYLGYGE